MRRFVVVIVGMLLLSTFLFGQAPLTDEQVIASINRAFTGKHHQIGLALNDKQTFFLSGLVCTTCQTSGYTIFVYTPESWIELQAVQARREMLPFGLQDVTPEMRLPYIHVLAWPSKADYLNANGMAMASSVHRVVLSSTDNTDVIQPLSESQSTVESNSALRSFTQTSAGAVFSLEDVDRLRSKDPRHEFFVVVVGDNLNKYFKVKAKFFNQLFGQTPEGQYEQVKASPQPRGSRATSVGNTYLANKAEVDPTTPPKPEVAEVAVPFDSDPTPTPTSVVVSGESLAASQHPQNRSVMFGFRVKNWDQGGGAEIVKIAPDSPADLAGLHVGDVIRSVDEEKVRSAKDLAVALANRKSPSTIRVSYFFHTNLGWMPGIEKVLTANGTD